MHIISSDDHAIRHEWEDCYWIPNRCSLRRYCIFPYLCIDVSTYCFWWITNPKTYYSTLYPGIQHNSREEVIIPDCHVRRQFNWFNTSSALPSCNDYPKVFIAWYSNPYSCIEIIEQYEVKTLIPSLFHLTNSEEFAKQIDSKSNYSNISEDMRK
jgi:hypothetical protein